MVTSGNSGTPNSSERSNIGINRTTSSTPWLHLKTPTSCLDPSFARFSWLELPQPHTLLPCLPVFSIQVLRSLAIQGHSEGSLLPRRAGSAHLSSSPQRTPIGLPVWGTAPVVGLGPGAQEPGKDAQAWGFTFHPGRNLRRAPVTPPSGLLPPTHRSVKLKHDPGSWPDLHRRDLASPASRLDGRRASPGPPPWPSVSRSTE